MAQKGGAADNSGDCLQRDGTEYGSGVGYNWGDGGRYDLQITAARAPISAPRTRYPRCYDDDGRQDDSQPVLKASCYVVLTARSAAWVTISKSPPDGYISCFSGRARVAINLV